MRTTTVKEMITKKELDVVFEELYIDESLVKQQHERYINAIEMFESLYGEKEIEIYSAAGRTEIGGNHTDHQNGRVLAGSINLDAIAVVAKNDGNVVRIKSEGYPTVVIELDNLEIREDEFGTTESLVRGVLNGALKRGYKIGGFEGYVTSNVLRGSGLSSSAAYEVLIGNIVSGLYNENSIDSITIAQIGQEAENQYFGKPCGLLDQMACSVGSMVTIDFADKFNPKVKKVDVEFKQFDHSLCIVDTKGSHADLTDEYAAIPQEMRAVAAYFGKELLCQVDRDEFQKEIVNICKKTGDRAVLRAIHWFEENLRVDAQVEALENGDFDKFKSEIKASGDSSFKYLQNVFAAKNVHDQKVSLALALSDCILKGAGVSRVHGGGFAGTIQAFVPNGLVENYKKEMEAVFGDDACYVLQIRADGGRKVV